MKCTGSCKIDDCDNIEFMQLSDIDDSNDDESGDELYGDERV